jgi:hypothetical protein
MNRRKFFGNTVTVLAALVLLGVRRGANAQTNGASGINVSDAWARETPSVTSTQTGSAIQPQTILRLRKSAR